MACNEKAFKEAYKKVAENWDIEKLFTDLFKIKKQTMLRAEDLSHNEKSYLCLLLLKHDPKKIAEICGSAKAPTVRTDISTKIKPLVDELLKQKKSQEFSFQRLSEIRFYLKEVGYYKTQNNNPNTVDAPLPVESLDNLVPLGWIWLGACDSTLPNPPVGSKLVLLGSYTPVTISPKEVPAVNCVVTVIENVHVREDRPQANSNYELFPIIADPHFLSRGTIIVIIEVDSYLTPTTKNTRTDKTNDIPRVRVWAKVGIGVVTCNSNHSRLQSSQN